MTQRRAILRWALALGVLAAPRAHAQVVRGTVVDSTSRQPIPEFSVLLVDERGGTVAAAMGIEGAAFTLRAPGAGRYRVRVLRIGYRSTTTPPFDLGASETLQRRIAVLAEPVSLAGIRVTGRQKCAVRPSDGEAATLWDEVQKAAYAVALSGEARRLRMTVREFARELAPDGRRVVRDTSVVRRGSSAQPYVSPSPQSLATGGYVQAADGAMWYYAPDAAALVSDAFVAGHCFRIADAAPPEPDLVGLAFEATRTGPPSDVDGVLWIDRRTAELRTLDFTYTALPRVVQRRGFGGHVAFQRVPGGAWITRAWRVRAPLVRAATTSRVVGALGAAPGGIPGHPGGADVALAGVHEEGGEVLAATTTDGRVVWASAYGALRAVVVDSATRRPLSGVDVQLRGTARRGVTNAAGAFDADSVPADDYTVVATVAPDSLPPFARTSVVHVGADAPTTLTVALPVTTAVAAASARRVADSAQRCAALRQARETALDSALAVPADRWHPAGRDSATIHAATRGAEVVLQAVVDTSGLAEPQTARMLRSGRGEALAGARRALAGMRFPVEEPIAGCKVRREVIVPLRLDDRRRR